MPRTVSYAKLHSLSLSPPIANRRVIMNPHYNRSTAFTVAERTRLRIRGLLPHTIEDLDIQVKRAYRQMTSMDTPIAKYLYLSALRDRNTTIFYKLILDHLVETLPIIYTPTIGQVCLRFAQEYRQLEGMMFSRGDRGSFYDMLFNWKINGLDEVSIIVVSDGSRILGLGDLGACGMGIPVGKCSLYVAAGGFHPSTVLPVTLDTGTNNQEMLNDDLYIGLRERRMSDEEFYPLVEEFMLAVKKRWPSCLVQFEDFSNDHCFELLSRWRHRMLCFNDDIQGTGVVTAAAFASATRIAKVPNESIKILIYGAGSAGIGIADQIVRYLEDEGVPENVAKNSIYVMDSQGLIDASRDKIKLQSHKKKYIRADMNHPIKTLIEAVQTIKPHALIGVSGIPDSFTPEVLQEMAKINERPIIFPLSNPTSKSECTAQDAYTHTAHKCLFASGSPFDEVQLPCGTLIRPNQCNNLYAFPGIGYGAWICQSKEVSDGMCTAAVRGITRTLGEEEMALGLLFPPLQRVREVTLRVAADVVLRARMEDHAQQMWVPYDDEAALIRYIDENMYVPEYV